MSPDRALLPGARRPLRRRVLAVLAAVAVALAAPGGMGPAQAVAAFGAAVRVTPTGCLITKATWDGTGTARGFASCYLSGTYRRTVVYVQGTGSTWRSTAVGSGVDAEVLSTADDGVNTYALLAGSWGSDATRRLRVLTRTRAGAVSIRALMTVSSKARGGRSSPTPGAGGRCGRGRTAAAAATGCGPHAPC